jgi:hypothetical protein
MEANMSNLLWLIPVGFVAVRWTSLVELWRSIPDRNDDFGEDY